MCADGLSKGMEVVDKHMKPGLSRKELIFSAGYAQGRIHGLQEGGKISQAEMDAALFVLDNRFKKLYRRTLLGVFT